MDRLEAMSMLVAVTERGSLSAAGRALQVPLATLSRKISDLEALLGTRLLIRTTRKLTLTDAGIAYVAAARRILEEVEEVEREAAGEFTAPKGELVVTAPNMFGRLHVLPVVADFLATFPEISIRLLLADRNVDLIGDHVDMAVRIGKLHDSSMVATQIGVMRTVTCASPTLLAGRGKPRTPNDLIRLPCVAVDTPMPSPSWRFRNPRSGAVMDVSIQPRLTVTTAEVAAQAAVCRVGVVRLLHYQAAEAVKRGELQIFFEEYEPEPAPVHLVHVTRRQMPLKMRRFLDFATPRLKEVLRGISSTESK
ncbi:MAG: LysR family transcriptional regulator [Proteobacteria bacterium]|nr:LysR family transcriptional regulator [Pseudomonadota bacterium]